MRRFWKGCRIKMLRFFRGVKTAATFMMWQLYFLPLVALYLACLFIGAIMILVREIWQDMAAD